MRLNLYFFISLWSVPMIFNYLLGMFILKKNSFDDSSQYITFVRTFLAAIMTTIT